MSEVQRLAFKHSSEIIGNVSSNYQHFTPYIISIWQTKNCPYCGAALEGEESVSDGNEYVDSTVYTSHVCPGCGWWRRNQIPEKYFCGYSNIGILHKTNLENYGVLQAGLDEIAKNEKYLYSVKPEKFESFVSEALGAFFDCKAIHTGKSHDGGIDIMLLDSNSGMIPVQVKTRQSGTAVESVRLVREFRGALLLAGASKGIIVSTAHHYSKESKIASQPKPEHLAPQEIDLIDCKRLLDILGVIDASKK